MCLQHLNDNRAASAALRAAERDMKTTLPTLGQRMGDSRYNLAQDWCCANFFIGKLKR